MTKQHKTKWHELVYGMDSDAATDHLVRLLDAQINQCHSLIDENRLLKIEIEKFNRRYGDEK